MVVAKVDAEILRIGEWVAVSERLEEEIRQGEITVV